MRVAITGGTGFVGRRLGRALAVKGPEVVLVARGADRRDASILELPHVHFFPADLSDANVLAQAFAGCDAVAHCAGINREIGAQSYQRVHVEGTRNVAEAARRSRQSGTVEFSARPAGLRFGLPRIQVGC